MPNYVTIDGVRYGAENAPAASLLVMNLLEAIRTAIEEQRPQLYVQAGNVDGEPTHTIVVLTPSSQVSAVVDRAEGETISQQWDEQIDAQDAARAKRRAALEAKWAAEDSEGDSAKPN